MRALLTLCLVFWAVCGWAQDDDSRENSFLINLVEDQLSTENMQFRIRGVDGALSSEARVERITIADPQGVWLEIVNAQIDWSRTALLRGRVDVSRLAAEKIIISRQPASDNALPSPEAQPFSLPDLPVSVSLDQLDIGELELGEALAGLAAVLKIEGRLQLAGGALDTEIRTERLDGAGGQLSLVASYANDSRQVKIDLDMSEPQGGMLASLLNIQDQPPLAITLQGEGPVEDLITQFQMQVDGTPLIEGALELTEAGEDIGFALDIDGNLQPLIPAQFADFFAGASTVTARGKTGADGFAMDRLAIKAAALALDGQLTTDATGFPTRMTFTGALGTQTGAATLLPIAGAGTTLQFAAFDLDYGQAGRWTLDLDLDDLRTTDLSVESLTLTGGGAATDLNQPEQRRVSFDLDGRASGFGAPDPAVLDALGEALTFRFDGLFQSGQPFQLSGLRLQGKGVEVAAVGQVDELVWTGQITADLADLSPFSGLAGRSLAGAANLEIDSRIEPLNASFDLDLTGDTTGLRLGDDRLDALLAGRTVLDGRVTRDTGGIRLDAFSLSNDQLRFFGDGGISTAATDLDLQATLTDIGLVLADATGPLALSARASGATETLSFIAEIRSPELQLGDRQVRAALVRVNGQQEGVGRIAGVLDGSGLLDDQDMSLTGKFRLAGSARSLREFELDLPGLTLSGGVAQGSDGLIAGSATLRADDLGPTAALALQQASGAMQADLRLARNQGQQSVTINGALQDLIVTGASAVTGQIDLQIDDAFGAIPQIDGTVALATGQVGGIAFDALGVTADQQGLDTDITATVALSNGTDADVSARIRRLPESALGVDLAAVSIINGGRLVKLLEPASLRIQSGDITLSPMRLDVDGGRAEVAGSISDSLDMQVDLRDIPLSLANLVQEDLGIGGTLTGSARVAGTQSAPDINFDANLTAVTAEVLREAGLPSLDLTATGRTDGSTLVLDADLSGPQGLSSTIRGDVSLTGPDGPLDLELRLASLPLVLLDRVAGGQGLRGAVDGQAQVGGTVSDPFVTFDMNARGVSVTEMSQRGIQPIAAEVSGQFTDNTVTLGNARVTGPSGLVVTANGRVPLSGSGLDLTVDGTAPLSLANTYLADRSAQVAGTATLDLRATGQLTSPQVNGTAAIREGVFVDPLSNLRLNGIEVDAAISGQNVTISRGIALFSKGGRLTLDGSVLIDVAAGIPADLALRLQRARIADGQLLTTIIDGGVDIDGPVLGAGRITGSFDLDETEVIIPDGFGLSEAELLDVTHRNPPRDVTMTLDRSGILDRRREAETARAASPLTVDVTINAPNQIFIRGRGLDTEVGGQLRITGPVNDIRPVGAFEMKRGRISILGQRVNFEEGRVSLIGSLDPRLDFVAKTEADDVTVFVSVEGAASDPQITFSSVPVLPQDEILARLVFNRSLDELSPFQVAQLAASVASLTGSGGTGLLGSLREEISLDNLDVSSDQDGTVAVRAGKYVRDNVYVDLEADSKGDTRFTINLDVTENLTARGTVGTDGNTKIGIFYERDY